MKNVLLIGGNFCLDTDANSICIKNIGIELIQRGCKCILITSSEKRNYKQDEGLEIYGLEESFYEYLKKQKKCIGNTLFYIFSHIRHVFLIPFFPNVSFLRSIKLYFLAKKIISNQKIDLVICFYRPFESVYCGLKLKKFFRDDINVVNFHLDLLSEYFYSKKRFFFRKKIQSFLKREYQIADFLFFPESVQTKQSDKKISYTGFPVCRFNFHNQTYDCKFCKDCINCVYLGSIDNINRNPLHFLEVVKKYNEQEKIKFILHIWGRLDDSVKDLIEKYDFIKFNGFVDESFSQDILNQSDFILNIGNKNTPKMLPSKIFKSFLSGKPILNFVKNREDVSLKYFNQYGHVLNIFEDSAAFADDVLNFDSFVQMNKGMLFKPPLQLIERNTPEFIVNEIEKKIM